MSFSDCSSAFSDEDNNLDLNSTLSSLESSVDFDEEYDYFEQEEENIKIPSSASKTKSASSLTLAQKRQRRHSSFSLFTKGISPSNYPTLLSLELASISGESGSVSRIAFCYRQERQVRLARPEISNPVKFDLTYHSLLFDVIKINLLKPGFLGQSHSKYGQAVLKLSEVEYKDGEYILQLPFVAYRGKQKNLGSVKLNCHFYNFVREKDPKRLSSTFIQAEKGKSSRNVPQRSSSVPTSLGSSQSSEPSAMRNKPRTSILLPLLEMEEADFEGIISHQRKQSLVSLKFTEDMQELEEDDYMDIYKSYGTAPEEKMRSSVTVASSAGESAYLDLDDVDNTFSTYIPSTQTFITPSPPLSETPTLFDPHVVEERKKIQRSKSLDSLSYSPPPSFQGGLNKNLDLLYALLATGWKQQSPLDFPRALGLLGKYYRKYSPEQRTGDIVQELHHLEEADYFMNFMLPAYGGVPRWFFGNGGLIEGLFKPNKQITMEHLFIAPNHMLEWHYGGKKVKGLFATTPSFYICYDKITTSIHLHCRGTFNIQDVFTDLGAEYTPFLGGLAHGGILNAAVYIRDNYLAKIMGWIKEFKASSLIITGHSLGAAVASIFLMLCREKVVDEMNAYNAKNNMQAIGDQDGFKCVAFVYAAPPCVSADIIEPFQAYISAYMNQHDIVPKLSYGAVMDMKALIQEAGKLSSMKSLSETQKLERIDTLHHQLTLSNKNPRLVAPGQIYFMYKREKISRKEKSSYVVEKSNTTAFDHFHLKFDMIWHHFPQKYDNSLKKAIAELEKSRSK